MAAVARERPNTGYALEADGRLKTESETKEGAWTGAKELKNASRCCGSKSMCRDKDDRGIPTPIKLKCNSQAEPDLMRPDSATDL